MGGRGGASGLSQNATDRFRRSGVQFVEAEKLDMRAVEQSLKGVVDVLDDMGIPLSSVPVIAGRNHLSKGTLMAVNGAGQLSFANQVYSSIQNAEKASQNENGYFVAKGLYSTGAHEAGHIAVNEIISRTMKNSTQLQRAEARHSGKIEKQIIREARKQYGSNPVISKYGSTKPIEKIAEAVSDVYTKKSRANPYSKVIVDIMKKKLRGR